MVSVCYAYASAEAIGDGYPIKAMMLSMAVLPVMVQVCQMLHKSTTDRYVVLVSC